MLVEVARFWMETHHLLFLIQRQRWNTVVICITKVFVYTICKLIRFPLKWNNPAFLNPAENFNLHDGLANEICACLDSNSMGSSFVDVRKLQTFDYHWITINLPSPLFVKQNPHWLKANFFITIRANTQVEKDGEQLIS